MDPLLVAHTSIFVLAAVVCLVSVPRARAVQHRGTRNGLVALLVSVAVWSGGYVGYLLAPSETAKLAFYIVGFVFAFIAVGAWLYFCAAYTGRPPRQAPYRRGLVGVFLLLTALKVTNPLHGLYFTAEWTTHPFPHLGIHHELLYWIILGLSYAVIAVGFFMLLERFHYTGADSRPLLVLAGVTAVPAMATILGDRVQWLLPLMYEPPGVALFAVGTLFVYRDRLEAIRLTAETDKPAVYLDGNGAIRDFNQAARRILPALDGSVGTALEAVHPRLAERLETGSPLTVETDGATRSYDVTTTPFTVGEVTTGRLVTITDVTARESYRQQLELKTEQLEALNRVVRHDIRNDMAVVLGWAETLEDHVDEEGTDALDRVIQKSRHVVELTETAREFTESLTGEAATEPKPVDLQRVLDGELAAVRDSFPNAQVDTVGEVPPVTVRGNEMLSSVFRNLLENAVRHNDAEKPTVTVTVEEAAETVRVRIADDGPGIPNDRKESVFGKGEKGLDSAGSGIGLYLVHTLTDQYGGDVWVEDNDPDGAVFVVELVKSA